MSDNEQPNPVKRGGRPGVPNSQPWTIKGMPKEELNAARAAAGREKVQLSVWIAAAIRGKIQADRSEQRQPVAISALAGSLVEKAALSPALPMEDIERAAGVAETLQRLTGKVSRQVSTRLRQQLAKALKP